MFQEHAKKIYLITQDQQIQPLELVLWANSSNLLLAQGHTLLVWVNDVYRG